MSTAIISVLLSLTGASPDFDLRFEPPAGPIAEMQSQIDSVLTAEKEIADAEITALATSANRISPHSVVAEKLARVVAIKSATARRSALLEINRMLGFCPQKEAELPEGFPTFTQVGVIELKKYPRYRKAVGGSFWPLFAHIKMNNIAMTTPVQMEYGAKPDGELVQKSMAFLYGKADLGKKGPSGLVAVEDGEMETVVSIGVLGARNSETIEEASERLKSWVASDGRYQAKGSVRVMGYNSPFVPRNENFFEVQLLLEPEDRTGTR